MALNTVTQVMMKMMRFLFIGMKMRCLPTLATLDIKTELPFLTSSNKRTVNLGLEVGVDNCYLISDSGINYAMPCLS